MMKKYDQIFMFPKMNLSLQMITLKPLEMHERILSTVATDALVLKHQAISIHSADWIFNVLN